MRCSAIERKRGWKRPSAERIDTLQATPFFDFTVLVERFVVEDGSQPGETGFGRYESASLHLYVLLCRGLRRTRRGDPLVGCLDWDDSSSRTVTIWHRASPKPLLRNSNQMAVPKFELPQTKS